MDTVIIIPHSSRASAFIHFLQKYIPYYTLGMFIIYMSIYYTICTDSKDRRNDTLAYDTYLGRHVYTWYTYSLLHLGTVHIASNMFTLFVYGTILEIEHGHIRAFLIHTFHIRPSGNNARSPRDIIRLL